jgi:hypothetical protein
MSNIEVCPKCYGAKEITIFRQTKTCGMCGGRGFVVYGTPPPDGAYVLRATPAPPDKQGYPLAAGGFDFTLTIEEYADADLGPGLHVRVWIHHPNEAFDWNGTPIGTFQDLEHAARACNTLFPAYPPAFVTTS